MSYRRRLVLLMAIVGLAIAVVGFWPEVQQRFAPTPVRAWVGIEVENSGHARVGRVEIEAGERFRLHAVLEARTREDERVFFTDAARLTIDGGEVAPAALQPWTGRTAKVLWFTVEGDTPVLFLEEGEDMSRFQYREFLRPEWGTGWSTSGSLDPAHDQHLTESSLVDPEPFGTQRFHIRIELFETAASIVPNERYASWGEQDLLEQLEEFPTVVARDSSGASYASSFFGLSEIVTGAASNEESATILASLTRKGIAYSGLTLLRDLVQSGGQPEWHLLDLHGSPSWGDQVRSGDLLRVGSRFVVLYRDRGEEGVLDRDDHVLDFHLGPKVVSLGEVFEGDGALEWAAVGRGEPMP